MAEKNMKQPQKSMQTKVRMDTIGSAPVTQTNKPETDLFEGLLWQID